MNRPFLPLVFLCEALYIPVSDSVVLVGFSLNSYPISISVRSCGVVLLEAPLVSSVSPRDAIGTNDRRYSLDPALHS